MSTLSPILNLKRPDDTDPFLTSDFVNNYNILDANPGVFICTSATKPAWGPAQAGRVIFQTDWKCFAYWDGSSWNNERAAPGLYAGGAVFNNSLSKGSTTTFNIINFTTPRSCSLLVSMNMTIACGAQWQQSVYSRIVFDGGDVLLGGYSDSGWFGGNPNGTGNAEPVTIPMLGVVNISAGSHSLGCKIIVGGYNTAVTLWGIKTVAAMGIYSSNQIL